MKWTLVLAALVGCGAECPGGTRANAGDCVPTCFVEAGEAVFDEDGVFTGRCGMEAINDMPTRRVRRGDWDDEPTARVVYLPATLRRFYDSADVYEALEEAGKRVDTLDSETVPTGDLEANNGD